MGCHEGESLPIKEPIALLKMDEIVKIGDK